MYLYVTKTFFMKSSYIIIESIKILFFYAFYKNFSQLLLDKNDNSLIAYIAR